MKKCGFTLVELLGVIVILGLLMLIAFPPIMNQIKNAKGQVSEATLTLIKSAADMFIDSHSNDYPKESGNVFCISLQTLVEDGQLKEPLTDVTTGKDIDKTQMVKATVQSNKLLTFALVGSLDCQENIPGKPSAPELADNMIPIKWNGLEWVKADVNNRPGANEWYDYYNKRWANAVTVTASTRDTYKNANPGTKIAEEHILTYFVWIPRFRYTVPVGSNPRQINVQFENKTTPKSNGTATGTSYYTHPSFTFGATSDGIAREVNGIWVGKFEMTGTTSVPTTKPNIASLANYNTVTFYNNIKAMQNSNNSYGFSTDTNKIDIHMMKNSDWGATAILSQSAYGRCTGGSCLPIRINNNTNHLTGCGADTDTSSKTVACNSYQTASGMQASTTGNIYGVYDMSGGLVETVMGNYNGNISSSGFTALPNAKYYDSYSTTTSKKGDASDADGVGSWHGSTFSAFSTSLSWVNRGSYYETAASGRIFTFDTTAGAAGTNIGTRISLVVF